MTESDGTGGREPKRDSGLKGPGKKENFFPVRHSSKAQLGLSRRKGPGDRFDRKPRGFGLVQAEKRVERT